VTLAVASVAIVSHVFHQDLLGGDASQVSAVLDLVVRLGDDLDLLDEVGCRPKLVRRVGQQADVGQPGEDLVEHQGAAFLLSAEALEPPEARLPSM